MYQNCDFGCANIPSGNPALAAITKMTDFLRIKKKKKTFLAHAFISPFHHKNKSIIHNSIAMSP
jgi:hypothetical protein